jgi:hypothetical protein
MFLYIIIKTYIIVDNIGINQLAYSRAASSLYSIHIKVSILITNTAS